MRCSNAFFRIVLGGAVVACSLGSLSAAHAAVYSRQQALSSQVIQQFLADPAALLAQYPHGGAKMIAQIRDLAASDPAILKALLKLLSVANAEQATAIGTGLGQVAIMALRTDQTYATQIQEAIVAAQNNSALVAFSAAVGGSVQLSAATGGGGGGGGGGGEEPTGESDNSGAPPAGIPEHFTTSVANSPDAFPSLFGSSNSIVVGGGGRTIVQDVSPSSP
jgi:hypothetical protein